MYILQIVKGTIDGAFRVGCKKRGKWPQAKGMHADTFKKLSFYQEKIMLFSIFDVTSNSLKNYQMNLYVTFSIT